MYKLILYNKKKKAKANILSNVCHNLTGMNWLICISNFFGYNASYYLKVMISKEKEKPSHPSKY